MDEKNEEAQRSFDLALEQRIGEPQIDWGLEFRSSNTRVCYLMILHLNTEGLASPCQCTFKECIGLVSLPKKIVSPFSWALIARTAELEQILLTICCQIPDYTVDKRSFLGLKWVSLGWGFQDHGTRKNFILNLRIEIQNQFLLLPVRCQSKLSSASVLKYKVFSVLYGLMIVWPLHHPWVWEMSESGMEVGKIWGEWKSASSWFWSVFCKL